MINFYNLIINENGNPKLNMIKQYDYNKHNISLEEMVNILNESENFDKLFSEYAYVVSCNVNMDILGIYIISIGDSKSCNFYKKNIMIFLLLSGADRFVLFHNHPSNILEPSIEDVTISYDIENIANIFSIEMIDSIIVCKAGWYCIQRKEGVEYDDEI